MKPLACHQCVHPRFNAGVIVAIIAFAAQITSAAINLGPVWDDGQYWIPRTYTDHAPEGPNYAVDFYWIDPQAGNAVRSAVQGAADGYDAAGELGRAKNVRAAHAGIKQLVTYSFSSPCNSETAQPELKIQQGNLTTYYIHLETIDPIAINDAVYVYSRGATLLNLRPTASTSGAPVATMPDGTRMNVIAGPTAAEGYTWWKLQGAIGTGWAVESIGNRRTLINSVIHRGNTVVVVGGVNRRPNPTTSSTPATLMADGTQMNIIGGPVQADGYTWWQLSGASGSGWAVDSIPAASGPDTPTLGKQVSSGDTIGHVSDQGCANRPHLMFKVYQSGAAQRLDNGSVTLNGETILSGASRTDGYNTVYNSMPRTASCVATLSSPASGATVSFPGTFSWTTSGSCPNTHLAFASSATPATAQVTAQLSGSGIITATEWAQIQTALGAASPYYWAVVESSGGSFTELSPWRPFQPVSSITSITPTPSDGAQGTVGVAFPLRVDVRDELIRSGVLQVWVYDSGFATSTMDWIYVSAAESATRTFNFSLKRAVAGARDYTLFTQFRPGATVGPLLTSAIGDIESSFYNYTVNWQVVAPEIAVQVGLNNITDGQATAIDFGSVERNAPAPTVTFTVRNDGNATLNLGSVSAPAGFTVTQDLPATLGQGGLTTTFVVRLDTASVGTKSGNVSFSNNDGDENPFNFPITGIVTSPEIAVQMGLNNIVDRQATVVDFGSVEQNAAAPSITFTVRNDGNQTLTLGSVSAPSGFTVTQNLPNTLAQSISTTFIIRLDTASVGVKSGNVSFSNNDSDENPFNFPIRGTVTSPSAPPSVSLGRQSNKLVVMWPASQSGFVLESATALSTNTTWTPVIEQPVTVGTNNVVTNIVGSGARFFRLRK